MKRFYALALLAALPVLAADPSLVGNWNISINVNGETHAATCSFKQDGDKLTGSVPGMGRGRGGDNAGPPPDIEITNAKVSGDSVTFEVHRQGRNGETVIKYEGTVSGDTMKLKVTAPGRGGGDPTTTEYTATRAKS